MYSIHLFSALVFITLLAVIFLTYNKSKHLDGNLSNYSEPFAILKKRYAKGEITKEEFERIKKDIL